MFALKAKVVFHIFPYFYKSVFAVTADKIFRVTVDIAPENHTVILDVRAKQKQISRGGIASIFNRLITFKVRNNTSILERR